MAQISKGSDPVEVLEKAAGTYGRFTAAEGAIGLVRSANKVREEPLKVILNCLGKDAAHIISRINGFTYALK